MKKSIGLSLIVVFLLYGCIQDDIINDTVKESIQIITSADTLAVGDSFLFDARFTNNIGQNENRTIEWASSNTNLLTIDQDGMAMGLSKGEVMVTAGVQSSDSGFLQDTIQLVIDEMTVVSEEPTSKGGQIRTTSSYLLEGDFTLSAVNTGIEIVFAENYRASRALPGLYVYLSNNPNSIADAFEIGAVAVFEGAHEYEVPDVATDDYRYLLYWCKPFRVKVGDGEIQD